jgi:subtilisin family serine protease
VAVVDTGVDSEEPDLRGAIGQWYDGTGAGVVDDVNGHGTLAAGIIAARANNGIGGVGACPWCSVLPVKVLGSDGVGETPVIAAGIRWAADHGARVINMSFVLNDRQPEITDAVAYAHDRGAVVVAAAGNTGTTALTYPAADPFVIGVAASQPDGSLYGWSDRGAWVEISAPGCTPAKAPGAKPTMFCGTSSASAVVSGVVALALSVVPGATGADVEQALRRSAVPSAREEVALGSLDARALVAELRAVVQER